ncbi:MAG: GNAT family N-acetyltransferase [Flavobacteriales bacterium]
MIASKALQLQPEEIQQLRNEVLWPHKSFENCILETDRLSTTFHFGVKVDGLTVATVTFQQEKSDKLKQDSSKDVSQDALQEKQYRLRAMAVREGYRGQGFGDAIVEAGLNHLRELGVEVVWCDARVAALNFYRRLHFNELEEEYEIPIIGMHRFMWKVLSSQV